MIKRHILNTLCRPTSLAFRVVPNYRCQSGGRTPWRKDTTSEPSVFVEENFAKHTVFVLDVAKRFIKFSALGLIALGATSAVIYEGTHLWVEYVELAAELDQEVKKWEWDLETEKWSGDHVRGGTDPALGFKGRHTVRAAWMAQNWGVGYSTAVVGSETIRGDGLTGPGGLNVIDARLQRTEDFLRTALSIAENRITSGKLNPHTLTELIARHATVLERLGPQSLSESKSQYERVWACLPGKGFSAARIALKLGDLNSRMCQADNALIWWSRAIRLTHGEPAIVIEELPTMLHSAPSSPSAQRLLSNILVSLSAFYATSGQLRQAQSIEEASLNMIRSLCPPASLVSASPPQALHALYMLQRSSLLSIHLAEVLHAQRQSVATSIQWLTSAAESSERVAHALTGIPLSGPEGFITQDLIPNAPALPIYTTSRSIKNAANGLLRDARRTAAEAWNLMGILNEAQGSDPAVALRCYERAINWAGTSKSDVRQAAEGTLESDWIIFWGNYTRAKRVVEQAKP